MKDPTHDAPRMLMLLGEAPSDNGDPPRVVAIRFFAPEDGAKRVLRLAKQQVKKRFPSVDARLVEWSVYQPHVAKGGSGRGRPGGFPEYLGEVGWYL